MKVAAIIPTYNRSSQTIRALKSVLNQTHTCAEILIVDDASTDTTRTDLTSFISSHQIPHCKLIELSQNSGVSTARNIGVRAAQSSWVAFLDSDDEWQNDKIEKQVESLQKTGLLISHTDETWWRDRKVVTKKNKHRKYGGEVFNLCVDMCFIGPSTSLLHRSLFEKHGGFDESFKVCEDYDLWLRLTAENKVDFVNQELIIKHGGHDDQLSTSTPSMDFWRLKALSKHFNSDALSSEQKSLVQNTFIKKACVFKKGCIKHKNEKMLAAVLEMEQLLPPSFGL